MIKKILLSLFIFFLGIVIWQYELLSYSVKQGIGQFKVLYNARPVEYFINDKTFPDSLKRKLRLVQEIRKFAIDSLGVNDTENYTSLYDQKGKPVLWILTASEPYRLKAKEWDFPFLGKVSYKGFFNHADAIKEEEELKLQGYDTDIGTVGGWSTLGWFNDPILSNMLNRSEGGLANLIIHELSHATVYVKSNGDFNENLATFIGNAGAFRFLEYKFGKNSIQYSSYRQSMEDEKLFNRYISQQVSRLDSLYKSFTDAMLVSKKDSLKKNMLRLIFSGVDSLLLYDKPKYQRLYKNVLPNNAYFISFRMYDAGQEDIEKEFTTVFSSDMKKYIADIKKKYP